MQMDTRKCVYVYKFNPVENNQRDRPTGHKNAEFNNGHDSSGY